MSVFFLQVQVKHLDLRELFMSFCFVRAGCRHDDGSDPGGSPRRDRGDSEPGHLYV